MLYKFLIPQEGSKSWKQLVQVNDKWYDTADGCAFVAANEWTHAKEVNRALFVNLDA